MTDRLQPAHADALILIGHGSVDTDGIAEYHQFARMLAARLGIPVHACFLEFADPPIAEGLRAAIAAGARCIVALPLFLGPAGHQKNDVPTIINWARAQWPDVQLHYGTPLGAHALIVAVLAQRAAEAIAGSPAPIPADVTALLVVGRGSRDPDSNSDVAKIARLLYEGRRYGWVETAFYSLTQLDVQAGIERCVRLGARRVVVLPYLLFTGRICKRIGEQARALQAQHPNVEILVAGHLGCHAHIADVVQQRYQETLEGTAAMTCDLCKYRHRFEGFEDEHGLPQMSDHHHGLRGVGHGHHHHHGHAHRPADDDPATAILPPRYQNGGTVSAAPMGAAPLKFDADGQVAWNEIWTDFCDLALAGGPPHRGDLLEPIAPEAVAADPAGYARVLAELERGIRMVTGLETVTSAPGWIGMRCPDEEMALWLLRAIVVENICVRREGTTLFLPVGPHFRLEHEIKNVITVVAKTHHYWTEHVVTR